MNPLLLFWAMLKASLLSTGSGKIPILHEDQLLRGWASEQQFAEALAIGQISPGPTGLWVISLGYLVDGVRGSLLAVAAITVPPLLVLLVHRLYRRIGDHPATEGFVRGLTLAVVGILLVVLSGILARTGIGTKSVLIATAALAIGVTRRVPVIAVLALGAIAGMLIY